LCAEKVSANRHETIPQTPNWAATIRANQSRKRAISHEHPSAIEGPGLLIPLRQPLGRSLTSKQDSLADCIARLADFRADIQHPAGEIPRTKKTAHAD
jgi:hypothetical protein